MPFRTPHALQCRRILLPVTKNDVSFSLSSDVSHHPTRGAIIRNKGVYRMQEFTVHSTKTGPIHLPKDGRPVHVQVSNLVKTFGKHEAVKGVSFTIGKGEIFGLLGPNGAGKSTIIIMMCGYLTPTAGDTLIAGISISNEPRKVKRMLGVVPQEIALYRDLSSVANLEFFVEMYGLTGQEPGARTDVVAR